MRHVRVDGVHQLEMEVRGRRIPRVSHATDDLAGLNDLALPYGD